MGRGNSSYRGRLLASLSLSPFLPRAQAFSKPLSPEEGENEQQISGPGPGAQLGFLLFSRGGAGGGGGKVLAVSLQAAGRAFTLLSKIFF